MCPSVLQGTCPQGKRHPSTLPPTRSPEKSQWRKGSREGKPESWALLKAPLPSMQGPPTPREGFPTRLGPRELLALKHGLALGDAGSGPLRHSWRVSLGQGTARGFLASSCFQGFKWALGGSWGHCPRLSSTGRAQTSLCVRQNPSSQISSPQTGVADSIWGLAEPPVRSCCPLPSSQPHRCHVPRAFPSLRHR